MTATPGGEWRWRVWLRRGGRALWIVALVGIGVCYLNDLPFYLGGRDLISWLEGMLLAGAMGEMAAAVRWRDVARGPRGVAAMVAVGVVALFVIDQLAARDYYALRPLWSSFGAMSDQAVARQWTQGNPYYPEEDGLRAAAAHVRAIDGDEAAVLYIGPHRGDVVNEPFYPTPVYMPPRLQSEALAAATLAWSSWRDPVFEAVRERRMAALGDVSHAGVEVRSMVRRHHLRWLVRIDPAEASKSTLIPLADSDAGGEGAP